MNNTTTTETKVVKKNVCIDTLFRTNYDRTISTDFTYYLPEKMNKVVSMKIAAVELPNMWYLFSSHNKTNQFTITTYNYVTTINGMQNTISKTEYNIVIPDGNYTPSSLMTAMQNYFMNTGGGLQYLNFVIDPITTRTTIRAINMTDTAVGTLIAPYPSASPNFYFTVDFSIPGDNKREIYNNAGWMLGFRQPFYTVTKNDNVYTTNIAASQVITYNACLTSESSYGSSIYRYVFLDIDDFNRNVRSDNIVSSVGHSYIGNNIIARLSVSSSQNTIIIDNGADRIFKSRDFTGPVKVDKLHIRLLNPFGDIIHLNGNDFSFILEFTMIP